MPHDAFASLRLREYRYFLGFRLCLTFATQMQAVIVGWQIYEITKDPLTLGLIGLAEVVPYIGTALFGGYVADHFNRRRIVLLCATLFASSSAALLAITIYVDKALPHVEYLFYAVIFATGIARGFLAPAVSALFGQIVPRELYLNAAAWNSNLWHIAAVAGPAVGGRIYAQFGDVTAYGALIGVSLLAVVLMGLVPKYTTAAIARDESIFQSIATGVSFVVKNQVIFGALFLDMVAVLFGGVVAVLPIFAADVLHTGPSGLGDLRAAPFYGSVLMGVFLALRPPMKRAGWVLLACVAGFGACMIAFALSTDMRLSLALLFIGGAFDSVSVVIRSTILQLMMPDHMRGRVSAVNNIFVGTSNELGAFESGVAARLLGLVPSVIIGGSISIATVLATGALAPKLRRLDLRALSGHARSDSAST
ncbi:MAG: MFS transporter [Candidatus Hydrogenedentes bacterium]|nr:MFS transporter [Candidatus Hydrogenedentota bacterium]